MLSRKKGICTSNYTEHCITIVSERLLLIKLKELHLYNAFKHLNFANYAQNGV